MYSFIRWIQNWKIKSKNPFVILKIIFCLWIFNDFLIVILKDSIPSLKISLFCLGLKFSVALMIYHVRGGWYRTIPWGYLKVIGGGGGGGWTCRWCQVEPVLEAGTVLLIYSNIKTRMRNAGAVYTIQSIYITGDIIWIPSGKLCVYNVNIVVLVCATTPPGRQARSASS